MHEERRQEKRVRVEIPARLIRRSGDVDLVAADISEQGAFLRTQGAPVHPHELVRLAFTLDDSGTELIVHGVVAHIVPANDPLGREPGVGISLLGLSASFAAEWSKAIRALMPPDEPTTWVGPAHALSA